VTLTATRVRNGNANVCLEVIEVFKHLVDASVECQMFQYWLSRHLEYPLGRVVAQNNEAGAKKMIVNDRYQWVSS